MNVCHQRRYVLNYLYTNLCYITSNSCFMQELIFERLFIFIASLIMQWSINKLLYILDFPYIYIQTWQRNWLYFVTRIAHEPGHDNFSNPYHCILNFALSTILRNRYDFLLSRKNTITLLLYTFKSSHSSTADKVHSWSYVYKTKHNFHFI